MISDNTDFQTTSLDDVVTSWHKLVKEANVQGVNENLELVYRLRPPPDRKQKFNAILFPEVDNCDTANTPKDVPTPKIAASENPTTGPSNHVEDSATALGSVSDLEGAQLQWALRQSMMPLADQESGFPGGK